MLVDVGKTRRKPVAEDGLRLLRHGGIEERRKALVQLRRDEVEPRLELGALQSAGGRGELLLGHLVRDVLDDGRAFGDQRAVVEHERGHIAERVHGAEVAAAVERLRLGVRLGRLERQARLHQNDVGGERAGAGGEVQLHGLPR